MAYVFDEHGTLHYDTSGHYGWPKWRANVGALKHRQRKTRELLDGDDSRERVRKLIDSIVRKMRRGLGRIFTIGQIKHAILCKMAKLGKDIIDRIAALAEMNEREDARFRGLVRRTMTWFSKRRRSKQALEMAHDQALVAATFFAVLKPATT